MAVIGTADWLEQAKQIGASSPELQALAQAVELRLGLRLKQDPNMGLDEDLNLIIGIEGGAVSVQFARNDQAEDTPIIVAMDYNTGKGILMGKQDMTQAYMGGKIKIAKGNLMDLAKYSGELPKITAALGALMGETVWPDELQATELDQFKQDLAKTMELGEVSL